MAASLCVSSHLSLVISHGRHGSASCQTGLTALRMGDDTAPLSFFDIRHGPANGCFRYLQAKIIPGFQKQAVSLHKALAESPVSSLPEITALRMFDMGPSRHQRDPHIRNRSAYKDSPVHLFLQMGHHQPLPVPVQDIFAAPRGKLQSAAPLPRLQKQVYLCIMAQGFKMSHSLHRSRYCLLINNIGTAKFHLCAKPLRNQVL